MGALTVYWVWPTRFGNPNPGDGHVNVTMIGWPQKNAGVRLRSEFDSDVGERAADETVARHVEQLLFARTEVRPTRAELDANSYMTFLASQGRCRPHLPKHETWN